MKFKVDGKVLDADHMRIHEICEAEKFLQVEADGGLGARTAVALFVALRRDDPNKPPVALADEVMGCDLEAFEKIEEDEARPPVEPAASENAAAAPDNQQTSGLPRLVSSG